MRWSSTSLLSTGYHPLDGGTRNASTNEGERARVERRCKPSRTSNEAWASGGGRLADDRIGEDPTTCLGRPADGQPDAGQGQLGAARRSPRSGGGRRTRATPGRGRALEGGGIPAGVGLRGSREPRPHVGHLHHHSRRFSLAGGRLARGALTDAGAIARARQQAGRGGGGVRVGSAGESGGGAPPHGRGRAGILDEVRQEPPRGASEGTEEKRERAESSTARNRGRRYG